MRSTLVVGLVLVVVLGTGCVPTTGTDQIQAGYSALEQRQFDQALASADSYLQQNPTGPAAAEAMYLRGRAIEQRVKADQGQAVADLQQARVIYQRAVEMRPGPQLAAFLYTSLGNVNYFLADYAAAEVNWSEAYGRLDRADLRSWVLYRIGLCQQRQGRFQAADITFAAVQRHFPNTEPARRAQAAVGADGFAVQVAAFSTQASADNLVARLRGQGFANAHRIPRPERNLHLVRVGPFPTREAAMQTRSRLLGQFSDAMVVP